MTISDRLPANEQQVERILRLGYHSALAERPPLSKEIGHCSNRESAYFFRLEKQYMEVPSELTFAALQSQISEKHRERIRTRWDTLMEKKSQWELISGRLRKKWEEVPHQEESIDAEAEQLVTSTHMHLQDALRPAAIGVISILPPEMKGSSTFSDWQIDEGALREKFYRRDKNYLTTLRLYYEMLLERPSADQREEELVVSNPGLRRTIAIYNRYARLIDITHQSLSYAKMTHHEQNKKRVRKYEQKPYFFHPVEVTGTYLLDVIPYVIEEQELQHDFIIGVTGSAVHDLDEDSELKVNDIIKELMRLADHLDGTIIQSIESGFILDKELARKTVKSKMLALLTKNVCERLGRILRILSDKTNLTPRQRGAAEAEFQQLVSSRQFPSLVDDKIADFLKRMFGLIQRDGAKTTRRMQHAMIIKILDRANNLLTIAYKQPKTQKEDLHGAFRLIAYAMLDYEQNEHPLYNALPRLIDVTVEQYERFAREHAQNMKPYGDTYLQKLREWQGSVPRYTPPPHVQAILDEYADTQAA